MTKEDFINQYYNKEFVLNKEKYTPRMFWQIITYRVFEDKKKGVLTSFDQAFNSFNPKIILKKQEKNQ